MGSFSWSLKDPEVFVLTAISEAFTAKHDACSLVREQTPDPPQSLFRGAERVTDAHFTGKNKP